MYTPQQALEAIKARINGEWDNSQLIKLGALGDERSDVLRIIETTDTDEQNQNYHILVIQNLKETETKPAKIKITSERRNQSVTISYDHEASSPSPLLETAIKHLKARGFEFVGGGDAIPGKRYLISTTFNKSIL